MTISFNNLWTQYSRVLIFIDIIPPYSTTHLVLISSTWCIAFRLGSDNFWIDFISTKTKLHCLNSCIEIILTKAMILANFYCHCTGADHIWTFQSSVKEVFKTIGFHYNLWSSEGFHLHINYGVLKFFMPIIGFFKAIKLNKTKSL